MQSSQSLRNSVLSAGLSSDGLASLRREPAGLELIGAQGGAVARITDFVVYTVDDLAARGLRPPERAKHRTGEKRRGDYWRSGEDDPRLFCSMVDMASSCPTVGCFRHSFEEIALSQSFSPPSGDEPLKIELRLANRAAAADDFYLDTCEYSLDGIAVEGLASDEYITPSVVNTYHYTRDSVANVRDEGLVSAFGFGGLNFPYVIIYGPQKGEGLLFTFWPNSHPANFKIEKNTKAGCTRVAAELLPRIVLAPGHEFLLGELYLMPFSGHYYGAMEWYLDWVQRERGLRIPDAIPDCVPDLVWGAIHETHFEPDQSFDRAIDEAKKLSEYGVNALYVANQWRSGRYHTISKHLVESKNSCVILPEGERYVPEPVYGGAPAHAKFVKESKKLGLRLIAWITLSGLGQDADEVRNHPEWFIRERGGGFASRFRSMREKHILDADPLSPGWRKFVIDNLISIRDMGYDGVFLDGMGTEHPNYASLPWYGRCQMGEVDQLREMHRVMKEIAPEFIIATEAFGCWSHAYADISWDRGHPRRPIAQPRASDSEQVKRMSPWDPDYPKIACEDIPDFVRTEQLSLLPGARVYAYDLTWHGFETFPWMYYGLTANFIPVIFHRFEMYANEYRLTEEEKKPQNEDRFWGEMKDLLRLRREHRELTRGPVVFDGVSFSGKAVSAYLKPLGRACSLVLINFSPDEREGVLAVSGEALERGGIGRSDVLEPAWGGGHGLRASDLVRGVPVAVPPFGMKLLRRGP